MELVLARTIVVQQYLWRSMLFEEKWHYSEIFEKSRFHCLIDGTDFGRIVHRWLYWLIPRLQAHLSSSGNDKEVFMWTVNVSSITFHVSERSSIGWYTSWPLLTNIPSLPDSYYVYYIVRSCNILLYGCLSFALCIIDNRKFNFLEFLVLFLQFFQIFIIIINFT